MAIDKSLRGNRKCKRFGFKRDGTCRKTKCPTHLTKDRVCAKSGNRTLSGKTKKRSTSKQAVALRALERILRREAKEVLWGKHDATALHGKGYIGFDERPKKSGQFVSNKVFNEKRMIAAADRAAEAREKARAAAERAKKRKKTAAKKKRAA